MAVANALMLGVTGLTFLPLLDNVADPPAAERTTNVRIVVGTDLSGSLDTPGLKGSMPGVHLYDVGGNSIGFTDPGQKNGADYATFVGGRNDIEIKASESVGGISPEYVAIVAGKDPVCIAWITVTTPTAQKYSFVGDIASQQLCNLPWYYQQESYDTDKNGSPMRPLCIWVGGTTGYNAFGYHLPDFVGNTERADQYAGNLNVLCQSRPRFWVYPKFKIDDCLPYFPERLEYEDKSFKDKDFSKVLVSGSTRKDCKREKPNSPTLFGHNKKARRDEGSSTPEPSTNSTYTFNGRLVVTTSDQHGASQLCNSEMSMGPDLISQHENLFCDMEIKKLYPLCNSVDSAETCFNTDSNTIIVGTGLAARDEIVASKDYHTVDNW